jgi:hypothetical protein
MGNLIGLLIIILCGVAWNQTGSIMFGGLGAFFLGVMILFNRFNHKKGQK